MWAQRKAILDKLEKERGTKLICYLTSDRPNAQAQIANDVWPLFANHVVELRGKGWTGKLDVLIFTTGGDTLAAFGLARLLRESADWIGALVPGKCHSAGTLFALGANEIFMCQAGTLSPIDPSLVTPLNPTVDGPIPGQRQAVPVSVESVAGFKALVEDWSLEASGKAEAFKTLADRVHPLALGAVYRSRQQIERLARTLLEQHKTGRSRRSRDHQDLNAWTWVPRLANFAQRGSSTPSKPGGPRQQGSGGADLEPIPRFCQRHEARGSFQPAY